MVVKCPHCEGTGKLLPEDVGTAEPYPCKHCTGIGFIRVDDPPKKPEKPVDREEVEE